ncbi:hypothetical protein D3C74_489130 [compost metagenome]
MQMRFWCWMKVAWYNVANIPNLLKYLDHTRMFIKFNTQIILPAVSGRLGSR